MQTSGATKFNAASPIPDINHTLKIVESVWAAIGRSKDGYPGVEIGEELAKHGLVIVEAAQYDRMRIALQLIGSCELDHLVVTVARNALAAVS